MKRLLVLSILGSLALAVCSPSAEAQLFGRWRRARNYNNGYYNGYSSNGWNNGNYNNGYYNNGNYNNGSYHPAYVPSYRTGAYQQGVVTTPQATRVPTLAPGTTVVAPGATVVTPRAVPGGGNGGYSFNGPNVLPGPAGQGNLPVGAGANPQYGAAPGGVGAGFGAGLGPAGSKIDEGTGTIGRP
ncbi:MAG TPA: hypothetical protein VIK18_14975 [Pirellulales bacterium]